MSGGAARHKASLRAWLEDAVRDGWIDAEELGKLAGLEGQGAEQLFESGGARPLTVGLFGGTGVGKSSLLNRLVGDAVAEVGLERPTSTQVTLYVHERYPLGNLEEFFPVERVRVLEHGRDEYRDVVWIDTPDIDSVERANRELVFEWLPYLDWLIYVVSPERYRDDAGWRILQERCRRHHWLFVMNRWDTATAAQFKDFARILGESGFDASRLIKTSCAAPGGDDFERLTEIIERAVAEHGLARLQQVGNRARLEDLHRQCERYGEMLGGAAQWRDFVQRGETVMRERLTMLVRYLRGEIEVEAADAAKRSNPAGAPPVRMPALPGLVSDYVQDIDSAIGVARDRLPAGPIDGRTRQILSSLNRRVADAVARGFRTGAARPGNAFQRGALLVMRKLVFGLPLTVCLVVAYVVLTRYQQGLSGTDDFLGFDFLAHSLMVLGLAALTPYLAARLLRPSVRRSIVKRVEAGLQRTRSETVDEWTTAMSEVCERRRALIRNLETIRAGIENELRQHRDSAAGGVSQQDTGG